MQMTRTNHGASIPLPQPFNYNAMGDKMLYVGSSELSYHCEVCNCNVFRQVGRNEYLCNGCNTSYTADD